MSASVIVNVEVDAAKVLGHALPFEVNVAVSATVRLADPVIVIPEAKVILP